jgi:hypothetical protein
MMMRLFPDLFARNRIAPVAHYPDLLLENLRSVAPGGRRPDRGAADAGHVQLGVLRARVSRAADGHRTGRGPGPVRAGQQRLHAHHARAAAGRRDLPPHRRRLPRSARRSGRTSSSGCRACSSVYRAGRVTLANAIGTGHCRRQVDLSLRARDDRVLSGRKTDPRQRADLEVPGQGRSRLHARTTCELVVKEVHGAGGYGMLVGPASTTRGDRQFAERVKANPANYIAQPTLALSTCPTYVESGIAPAPHRPAPVRAERPRRRHRAGRTVPRGTARRLAGGELVAGRRHQGHLGAGKLMRAERIFPC